MKIDDNKIHIVYGEKGSGKTTFSAYICDYCIRHKIDCYSNTPLQGAYKITIDNIRDNYIEGGVVIIDEAAAEINCRDWRQTGTEFLRTIQMARHMNLSVYFITQSVNALDVQVTELVDDGYNISKCGQFSIIRKIFKYTDKRSRPYFRLSTSIFDMKILYRKKYYKYFDTHYITSELAKRQKIKKEGWN